MKPDTNTKPGGNASPSRHTKKHRLIELLRRKEGASLDEMTLATGWLPHTTRAMLTGLRKKGFVLDKEKVEGITRYVISSEPAA